MQKLKYVFLIKIILDFLITAANKKKCKCSIRKENKNNKMSKIKNRK